ncbi:hypothetical protein [Variovorax sp. N23]|uniref:hypothetical protein n=1 Tax=Variovorax sp. N23 TaxID=2980555 RepID=UPI0021C82F43|nr:hypothetical protein [Variovorax sp. N23]MCU4118887.1 hypothetical protein [Variovorax sp. N23]
MATRPRNKDNQPRDTDAVRPDQDGKTKVEQGGESAPKLPHERDESSDSQQNQDGSATELGRRAHDDVERGVVDTSRGVEADRVYNDKVRP